MFLLATTALAGVLVGWPCQRLNWGWRNVWSTCSIHSWSPTANTPESPLSIPTGFRTYAPNSQASIVALSPINSINAGGWYQPAAAAPANFVPQYFCNNAAATGAGSTSALRNRCRRAVDAYGALTRLCSLAPQFVAPQYRGPNLLSPLVPDNMPASGHQPHVTNVLGLTHNAAFCSLPITIANAQATPAALGTPSTVCPGLLGWFTVVYNACGFTNAPALAPVQVPNGPVTSPNVFTYFPLGHPFGVGGSGFFTGGFTSGTQVGTFCKASGGTPDGWNAVGANFRSSRCRKALDQFGRTAQRCHQSTSSISGPAQAGGYSDPLRLLALGTPSLTAASPSGLAMLAPACN